MAILVFFLAFSLISAAPRVSGAEEKLVRASDKAEYFDAVEQELARLALPARCDRVSLTCSYPQKLTTGEMREIHVKLSPKTDTIYIYIDDYLTLQDPTHLTLELAQLLLAYNRELVTAKFEWDKMTASVRLSTTINTDSNLDRKSLRSQLKGLWSVADRLWPSLKKYTPP